MTQGESLGIPSYSCLTEWVHNWRGDDPCTALTHRVSIWRANSSTTLRDHTARTCSKCSNYCAGSPLWDVSWSCNHDGMACGTWHAPLGPRGIRYTFFTP